MRGITLLRAAMVVMAVATTGCSLPRGAAMQSEITGAARNAETADFAVQPVTRAALPALLSWPSTDNTPRYSWMGRTGGSSTPLLAAGDVISLVIWDSAQSGLLAGPGALVTPMSDLRVSGAGEIFIPYVGNLRVSGMSPDHARETIQTALDGYIPGVQVQLAAQPGRGNTVDMVSGVAGPGAYPLVDRNTTVLSLIAQAGGVPAALNNPRVKIFRGSKIYGTSLESLYESPDRDALVLGGDRVIVTPDERTFLALGATGSEAMIEFPKDTVTVADALSLIGGISDSRADPRGLLILRSYPASALRSGGPTRAQVVFTVDLTSADGLFAASKFPIMPDDLVYATESPVANIQTVFGLVGRAFGLSSTLGL
ncbi:Polysaccharide biosynthesis/export protein [Aquimixticola soesokkakensis]|uniref:Polysaccharide biosynthesis/export protein n=1 Tax=Aquimixticola soesokkakensis TaxID=1519096 RepID=A0A1Y5RJZ3_9RHOB|nr:polysaccharide biosynthesis/export family protein [Aquimixticola soesokkakensis]SLN19321.1 Polysaccharide biosynthesis/export protein [Aquimixticola soesokkakensis]